MSLKLPNFFIVGAPKAGTTSLYSYLQKHPQVFMCPVKEPNYFAYDYTVAQELYHKEKGISDWKKYLKLFDNANGAVAVGEASVSYLFYPGVAKKIRNTIDDAKIIIVLRDPVERAFSHYYMEYKLGYVDIPIQEILTKTSSHKLAKLFYQQYIELGLYAKQVKRYLDAFGKDGVKIFIYEEMIEDMDHAVTDLHHFLGVNNLKIDVVGKTFNPYSAPRGKFSRLLYRQKNLRQFARRIIPSSGVEMIKSWFLTRSKRQEKPAEAIEMMKKIFRPDIAELEQLLGRKLNLWYDKW